MITVQLPSLFWEEQSRIGVTVPVAAPATPGVAVRVSAMASPASTTRRGSRHGLRLVAVPLMPVVPRVPSGESAPPCVLRQVRPPAGDPGAANSPPGVSGDAGGEQVQDQ